MDILVTGGMGYIGSHAIVELQQQGYNIVIVDNLSNSSIEMLDQIEKITACRPQFIEGDIQDSTLLNQIFKLHPKIVAVMHFAGLKAVGESVEQPLPYYQNNVAGTLCLLQAMQAAQCKTLVFSSSATVYQATSDLPLTEEHALGTTNPYGASKLMVEDILRDLYASDKQWRIAILRYFNPVGAHQSGLIGENPRGIPNNLLPYVAQVAAGLREQLQVFGDDYATKDGTGVRDYIHVVDLAKGHVKALEALQHRPELITVNLGTGVGYSVLEMIAAFAKASGREIPYQVVARRAGDIAECFANPISAKQQLQWQAQLNLQDMCDDAWRWQQNCLKC